MCSLFFERFVLFFCLKIERFVPETTEIWICGLYIPLFVEGGNIFLHPNNDSYVSLHGIVGNWRNISVSTSLNNNDDNVMFINTGNIEVTLPPDVPGHTIYFKRMSGGVRLTGGRILPAPGGKEMSSIDLDYASGFVKCMGNYWVMFYCG